MTRLNDVGTRILSIGIHPSAFDYSQLPGLYEAILTARTEAANRAVQEAGFDPVFCLIGTSPDAAESTIRDLVSEGPFTLAMIGAGVRVPRDNALLMERIINVLNETCPGVRFCFNSSPESTIDSLRRWVTP
jgi:hypothetical protein